MKASNIIPKERREEVAKVVLYVRSMLPSPPPKHLEWLFEVYNTYFNPNPAKCITCRTDRAAVLDKLYACVVLWKKQEEISQNQ
jgi:hypothetical protein